MIGKDAIKDGKINGMELAEEIQHGLNRTAQEASKAAKDKASQGEFHSQL